MKELQQLQERLKEIKEECTKNIQGIKICVEKTNPRSTPWNIKAFQVLFGEEFKSFRFDVIEPNDYVSMNSIIESRDAIFDEDRFTSIPKPRGMIQPSSSKIVEDEFDGTDDVPGPSVPRKSTRTRKAKSFGSDFQLYLVEVTRDKTLSQRKYCFIIKEDPRTLSEAMASRDVAFWKEAVLDFIMHNDTWELTDLPPGCKALGWFVMPGHESKVCKLKKSLYGLKQAPKQWHQKFDDVVLSNSFSLNQAEKCVYSKFDASGKGVIICLYVDDMLIFGTNQDQVNKTKEFLSSNFDMKDLGKAKILLTRPDIAFAIGKLSRYTSNPSSLHWQALGRVFQYLKGTMDYGLTYSGYPSVIEGYSDSSWINNMEDHSSTSGWVFLLGGGAISWTSKKQTCITSSTMESEFVVLAAAGNEAEWLRNLVYETPPPNSPSLVDDD
ncbi:zinc finger, CCHC-type containing protein [Tanacetum coccineum]